LNFFFSPAGASGGAREAGRPACADTGGSSGAGQQDRLNSCRRKGDSGTGKAKGKVQKGRRHARKSWGNPEVLRAHREKADAGLAAALPMLAATAGSE
jgi:hypothetical protein